MARTDRVLASKKCPSRRRSVPARVQGTSQSGRQRSVIILPGLGNNAADYADLAANLHGDFQPSNVHVIDVARVDWLRNAAGLLDRNYWAGTLKPRPTVDWYLNKVKAKVDLVKESTGGGPISFVAHSAGGWLGRTYLVTMESPEDAGVDCFVSLGSPHTPPPKDVPGAIDQTRGILTWVNAETPGAFHEGVKYVTVCGQCIRGRRFDAEGATFEEKITGQGYKQVCGSADASGDGIVPSRAAHLSGALQINLEGVYHSPIGRGERKWYGDAVIVDEWLEHLHP